MEKKQKTQQKTDLHIQLRLGIPNRIENLSHGPTWSRSDPTWPLQLAYKNPLRRIDRWTCLPFDITWYPFVWLCKLQSTENFSQLSDVPLIFLIFPFLLLLPSLWLGSCTSFWFGVAIGASGAVGIGAVLLILGARLHLTLATAIVVTGAIMIRVRWLVPGLSGSCRAGLFGLGLGLWSWLTLGITIGLCWSWL